MLMWEAFTEDQPPVLTQVFYDEEEEYYIVRLKRGKAEVAETIECQVEPVEGAMNIKDVEKAIKKANVLYKQIKRLSY